jgi:hypothetical protein
MDRQNVRIDPYCAVESEAVETLIEEIRLTALNMAISAARLNITGDQRVIVRKKISDLVNIALETVNRLTRILKVMADRASAENSDPSDFLSELAQIESTVHSCSQEIVLLLRSAGSAQNQSS